MEGNLKGKESQDGTPQEKDRPERERSWWVDIWGTIGF